MLKRGTGGKRTRNKLPPLPVYQTIKDDPEMGLNNIRCTAPVAFCHSKQVYLSAEDIELKRCLCKPTLDMIGTEQCKKLEYLERT